MTSNIYTKKRDLNEAIKKKNNEHPELIYWTHQMIWQVNHSACVCNLLKLALFSKALQGNVCITQCSSATFLLYSHTAV